jgi:plasmid stabilization system protein ParE
MQLQFSRRSDKDLDRLYEFLTEASHSIKTADKALKAIKDGATSLLDRPRYGNGPAGRHRAQRVVYSIWEKQLYSALQNRLRGESNPAFADLAQLGRKEINSMDCEADDFAGVLIHYDHHPVAFQ